MRKVYKKLSTKQINEGIIFTSTLSKEKTEQNGDIIHKILKSDDDRYEAIARLKNDRFFNNSHYNYNIIRREVNILWKLNK